MPSAKGPQKQKKLLASQALLKCLSTPEDTRPTLYFLAGPNGAGKSTVHKLLSEHGAPIPFINADLIAKLLKDIPDPDVLAQKVAELMRDHLAETRTSFATETVFSDPHGAKLAYLKRAQELGFRVVLIAVWIPSSAASAARVRQRVANGGHTVPLDKLARRYAACMQNLKAALAFVETAIVFDNSGPIENGPQLKATLHNGKINWLADKAQMPMGIAELLPLM